MCAKTFLVADDDDQFRQLMEEILIKVYPDEDNVILHAATGTEAITVFDQSITDNKPVDIVITDYAMPGASGSEVIEYIIGRYPVPIIVVSAVPEAHNRDFIQEGAIYFLPKPFDVSTAKKVVNAALAIKINHEDIHKAKEAIENLKNLNI